MKRPTYTITLGDQTATSKAWNTALGTAAHLVRNQLQRGEVATRQPLTNSVKPDKWTTSAGTVPYLTNTGRTITVTITSDYETIRNH